MTAEQFKLTHVGVIEPEAQVIEYNGRIYVFCPSMPAMGIKDGKLIPVKLE